MCCEAICVLCSERRKRDASGGGWSATLFGKKGWLSFLTQTQLCPVIWAIVIGLMASFYFKVRTLRKREQSHH